MAQLAAFGLPKLPTHFLFFICFNYSVNLLQQQASCQTISFSTHTLCLSLLNYFIYP